MNFTRSRVLILFVILCGIVFNIANIADAGKHSSFDKKDFQHDINWQDPDTGEVVRLKSKGQFRNIIDLNTIPGIKRIICVSNKLLLSLEDSQVAASWTENDVIAGDSSFECQMGLSHEPNNGIFRKIVTVKIPSTRYVEIISTEASLYDVIEHAHIFYHHTPPKEDSNNNTLSRNRQRRGFAWLDTFWDTATDYALSKIFPINWGNTAGPSEISAGINYDKASNTASGKFGVAIDETQNIAFDARESTWFQHEQSVKTDTSTFTTSSNVKSTLECVSCYLNFKTGLTFEFQIERDGDKGVKFKKYLLQFDAEMKLNYDVKFEVNGEFTANFEKLLWRAAKEKEFNIPIANVFGATIYLTVGVRPELKFEASFSASAKVSTTFGFESYGKYTITSQKIGRSKATLTRTTQFNPFKPHSPNVNFIAEASGHVGLYPLLEITSGIGIGFKKNIFLLSVEVPMAIGLKPEFGLNFELSTAMGSALVGTFDVVLGIDVVYEIRKAKLELSLVGQEWEWDMIEIGKSGSEPITTQPLALVSHQSLTCNRPGNELQPQCDKPGIPITSTSNKRLKKLDTSRIEFTNDGAKYMAGHMATKIDRFADLVKKEKNWRNRKLIVKSAWSRTGTGLVAEGVLVTIGISKVSSQMQETVSSEVNNLVDLARCAGFCNVKKSGSNVIVGHKGTSYSFGQNMYITGLSSPNKNKLRVYEFPVGQGDATVIQCPNGQLTIVDMGTKRVGATTDPRGFWREAHIKSFLSGKLKNIKHIFITHYDEDHYNIISRLFSKKLKDATARRAIKLYYPASQAVYTKFPDVSRVPVAACSGGSSSCRRFSICTDSNPNVNMDVVASEPGTSSNDKGLILRLNHLTFSMLFVGDLTSFASRLLASSVKSTVYKLSHHGSSSSNTANKQSFLSKVQPQVVLSSGDPWYSNTRHPRCSVIDIARAQSTVAKTESSKLRYSNQEEYVCGDASSGTDPVQVKNNKHAVYTHAPTPTSINLIKIEYNTLTTITKVAPTRILTDSHKITTSGRRKRDSDFEESESSFGGSDMPSLEWCPESKFPSLGLGESRPAGKTMNEVCRPMFYPITRDDERFLNLYFYPFDDVIFNNEERLDSWCGSEDRKCTDCREDVDPDTNMWDRCADRIMSFRLAFRLRRLAFLASQQWDDDVKEVKLFEAWDEPTSSSGPLGMNHGNSSLHYEGRAAQLALTNVSSEDISRLAGLASCAGFDYVRLTSSNMLEVCVLPQEGDLGEMVPFLKTNLLAVEPPTHLVEEYGYPGDLLKESRKIKLFDGYNVAQKLSNHFKIGDIVCPGKRFFRIDEKLVECLEGTIQKFGNSFEIIKGSAYRVRSRNLEGIESRHAEEKYRFQTGQAVELRVKSSSTKTLFDLSKEIVQSCVSIVMYEQLAIGIGLHADKLYLDIRPSLTSTKHPIVTWNTARSKRGVTNTYNDLVNFVRGITEGGPLIEPLSEARACRYPPLGTNLHFLSVETSGSCSDEVEEFCDETRQHRVKVVSALEDNLRKILGHRMIGTNDLRSCLVDTCGCRSAQVAALQSVTDQCEKKARSGDCDFYKCFEDKHRCGSDGYPVAYGYKYCSKFSQCYSQFDSEGQAWIDGVRKCLMEGLLDHYNRDSVDCDTVREHAFDTHPGCYVRHGFCQIALSIQNQRVLWTCVYNIRDFFNFDAVRQIIETLSMCGAEAIRIFRQVIASNFDQSIEAVRSMLAFAEDAEGLSLPALPNMRLLNAFSRPQTIDLKALSCSRFLQTYIDTASSPFPDLTDKAAFYNTDTVESSVHSLACENHVCLEKTQLYSLLIPVLTAKYRPYPGESIEERLYSERDNPNPSLDILEQMMAMHAKGHVHVYIESDMDFSAMTKSIKILTVYNKKVSKVTFHVAPSANKDILLDNINRKIEVWAGNVCPRRSRVAVAPFEVADIAHPVVKRSLEQSESRNRNRRMMHNWELHWLAKS